jgi:hypothetical protein
MGVFEALFIPGALPRAMLYQPFRLRIIREYAMGKLSAGRQASPHYSFSAEFNDLRVKKNQFIFWEFSFQLKVHY